MLSSSPNAPPSRPHIEEWLPAGLIVSGFLAPMYIQATADSPSDECTIRPAPLPHCLPSFCPLHTLPSPPLTGAGSPPLDPTAVFDGLFVKTKWEETTGQLVPNALAPLRLVCPSILAPYHPLSMTSTALS